MYRDEVGTMRSLLEQIDSQVEALERENEFLESELSRRQIDIQEIELHWKSRTEIWKIEISNMETILQETFEKIEKKEEVIGILRADVEDHVKQKEVLSQHVRQAQIQVAQMGTQENKQNKVRSELISCFQIVLIEGRWKVDMKILILYTN